MTDDHDELKAQRLLRLLSRAERLEAFPRTGWQVCGVTSPESVAAHSYMVALTALWLADHVGDEVDVEKVLRIALVHDLSEAVLGDIPRPVKALLGATAVEGAEDRASEIVFSDLDGWRSDHDEYGEATSPEARLVKAADKIQMLAKALQYRAESRGRTDRFFADRESFPDYGFSLVAAIFDLLFHYAQSDQWFPADFD